METTSRMNRARFRTITIAAVLFIILLIIGKFALHSRLPTHVEQAAYDAAHVHYSMPMTWGPYFDELVEIEIVESVHPHLDRFDRARLLGTEDLWCLKLRVVGQRQNSRVEETAEWFVIKDEDETEWRAVPWKMLSYPWPWLCECEFATEYCR